MSLLDSTAAGIVLPEFVGPLVVQPLRNQSTALQIATEVQTPSPSFRLPVIDTDAACDWVPEGSDITPTDPSVGEEVVVPKKVAALVKVSNELASDSSPAATAVVGDSLARSLARKIDSAFFGNTVANGPSGLLSVAGISHVASGSFANFDGFVEAQSKLERVGSTVTAWAASYETVRILSEVKKITGTSLSSNENLLADPQAGAAGPTARTILGVPLYSLPEGVIDDGIVWAIDQAKTFAVIRQDISLTVDPSFYFGSDSLAVRVVMRCAFGYPHPAAICKISASGS